jgi:pumilio RNA-binding family
MVGADIMHLSVPIDLFCALLLTKGGVQPSFYSLEDVLLASENLKRFREVAGGSPSTTASSSVLDTPAPAVIDAQPEEVDIVTMSLDLNGATLVQEMISRASPLELELIFNQLSSTAVLVSINTHGCRVIQRALESGSLEQTVTLFHSIPTFKLVDLCMDVNGNHVMQKFVEVLPQSVLHEIVMVLTDPESDDFTNFSTVARLSLHSYGCRVIQRLLVRCSQEDRSILLGFIITCFPELVADQFGNYVAQHALEHSSDEEKRSIIATLTLMDVFGLCCNKFASNVIEKAVRSRISDKTVLHRLITTIIQSEEGLLSLMKDKYGNYVVKAICDLPTGEFPEVLYVKNLLIAHSGTLKKYTYGYHLVEKLERSANGTRARADSNVSQSSGERRSRGHNRNM